MICNFEFINPGLIKLLLRADYKTLENALPLQDNRTNMKETCENIKKMIDNGLVDKAVEVIKDSLGKGNDAELYYLMGNACMKKGERKEAMNAYRKAEKIDPESPAVEARRMIDKIMAFYNKDLYNH